MSIPEHELDFLKKLLAQQSVSSNIPTECMNKHWIDAFSPTVLEEGFESNDKTGKWCIFVSEKTVDEKWKLVKEAVERDELLIAKVATKFHQLYTKGYVICVYTKDWSDEKDLKASREVLRNLGFKRPLKYKRDIETINRVYGTENEFYLTL